jgi:hypothetical protein
MRLLSTENISFKEFHDPGEVKYAVLSHTWGEEEVTYTDMLKRPPGIELKSGYCKVESCAEISKSLGYKWTWVDTAYDFLQYKHVADDNAYHTIFRCIDKRSSAELTEAINSMFDWYLKSQVCIVYLAHVYLTLASRTIAHP